jgi:TPR repeat protein
LSAALWPNAALRYGLQLAEDGDDAHAFPFLARAARAGIAEGECRVGRCYLAGLGVPVSRAEGLHWLTRAALQGHVEAKWQLAVLYLQGFSPSDDGEKVSGKIASLRSGNEAGEPDFVAAERWARVAAEAGSGDGQAILAYILSVGPDAMRDVDAARHWYKRSAQKNCPQGALGYALLLAREVQDEAGKREVVEYLGRAAKAGLATALCSLGDLTRGGIGVARSEALAADLYRRAAEKGCRSGQARWGLALIEGRGVERNPTEGESWLRRAALAGDSEAALRIGNLYARSGAPLPPNYAEAAIWYRRAAEAGSRTAARSLGLLHLTGAAGARDPDQAAQWLRVSAEAGDQRARTDLANLSLRGVGHHEELWKARECLEQAAGAGDLVAAFNLAACLADGVGMDRDESLAAQWMRKAADGVVNAQYRYGCMLVEGHGVPMDVREGRAWIARAAAAGIAEAEVALAELMVSGRGGPRDPVTARTLLEKAARTSGAGSGAAS